MARDGRYLIGLRPAGVPLAGLWEFPGGKLRPGESAPEAAQRECLEETGLHVTSERVRAVVEHAYAHGLLRLHFVDCQPGHAAHDLPERFRWVTAGELSDYDFPPANATVLEQLRQGAT